LFILFGSRAQGTASDSSDWDFGYLCKLDFDDAPLYTELVLHLEAEKIDLVNLDHANGLLRSHAEKDGIVIYERYEGCFNKFWIEVVDFWCDAGPLIRAEYKGILEEL
jgi:predicted nucleotidyltransferase